MQWALLSQLTWSSCGRCVLGHDLRRSRHKVESLACGQQHSGTHSGLCACNHSSRRSTIDDKVRMPEEIHKS